MRSERPGPVPLAVGLVAPLAGYFLVVALIPRLRRSLSGLRVGRLSALTVAATLGLIVGTTLVLVGFHAIMRPDVRGYSDAVPFRAMGGAAMAGVVFSIVNATLEELVFRGVLFEALDSQWGPWVTLVATSVLFGLGHLHGYPPGPLGACMAAGFGFAVGSLRLWTGGLLLPIVAHMGADATIYGILLHAGAV